MLFRVPLLIATVLSLCLIVLAQSQANTGNIEGRVTDPNSASVVNVTVTATNLATGLQKTAQTNDEGVYRIVFLTPGAYKVETAGAQGFVPATFTNVIVTVGGQTPLDIQLAVGNTAVAMVDVSAEGQVVETTRTSVSSVVNERAIQNLPVNGRNFLDFATLTPGVVRDPTRQGDLAVGGQKGTLNSLQVDGADNNNTFFGQSFGRTGTRPPYQFSEESVQEFQVNQNGFSAEFGRAGGAVINVVTKSGTNVFHGGLFEYFRDESLNANDPITKANEARRGQPNKRPPFRINQFGGRLGGPIKHDKAFFFFTYDGQRSNIPQVLDVPNLSTAPAAALAIINPKLGTYQVGRSQDVFLGKAEMSFNQ